LTLAGSNSYTGGTLVSSGTLIGNTTSLQGAIIDNATLTFDQSANGTFNGTILGTGSMIKSGLGSLSIAGANPFSGTLSVTQGLLALNGSFAGDATVGSAAELRGSGLIGGSLNLGGTLTIPAQGSAAANFNATRLFPTATPDTLIPSLVIGGNFTTTPGSVLNFTVTPSGVAPIVVNGLTNLVQSHLNVAVNDPNPARYNTYLGLTSGGLLTAQGLDATSPTPGIVPVLKYDPHALYITVLNENIPLAGLGAVTGSGAAVAAAIDRIKRGATGDFGAVVRELTALPDQPLNNALQSLSGELHSTELRLGVDESRAATDLVRDAIDDRDSEEGPRRSSGSQSMRVWFQLSGDHASYSPGGVASATADTGGGGGGLDFRPAGNLILGGGGSFSKANMSMLGPGGSSDMQAPRAFGYAGWGWGPFGFHGGASVAKTTYVTHRPIVFQATIPSVTGDQPLSDGIDRVADSDQTGTVRDAWSEMKDTYKHGSWVYDWKLGFRAATYSRDPFTETGAASISLTGLTTILQTREADVNMLSYRRSGTWRPRIYVSYLRQLGDQNTTSNMQIGDQPAGQYEVTGVPIPVDVFHGVFGVTMHSAAGLEYTFEYETQRAKDEDHNAVHFRVRFK
jgi:autotransporter-associated beta strand protein